MQYIYIYTHTHPKLQLKNSCQSTDSTESQQRWHPENSMKGTALDLAVASETAIATASETKAPTPRGWETEGNKFYLRRVWTPKWQELDN